MRHNVLIKLSLLCLFMAWSPSLVQATPIPLDYFDGANTIESGWTVEISGATTGVTVTGLNLTEKTLTITIAKDYGPYTYNPTLDRFQFPIGFLDFNRVDGDKIDRIIVLSEDIENHSGAAWDTFGWKILTRIFHGS